MQRREFLKFLSASAAIAVAGGTVAACSTKAEGNASSSKSKQELDTLRIAAIGGPGEKLNISEAASTATWVAIYAVFESLVIAGAQEPQLMLAKSIKPNEDATSWTITLREDAKFSDGSPVTARDVLESIKYVATNPMHGIPYADVDLAASKTTDDTTVELKLTRARADFVASVLGLNSLVYKDGDPSKSIGSGPYVVSSGDSNQGWKLDANPHFPEDKRVSNSLEIQVIADPQARMRAVNSGAVDLAMDLPATASRSLHNAEVWIPGTADSKGLLFVLNTEVEPFNDVEVRRAIKMALDREALVKAALGDVGSTGADVPGLGFNDYPSDLPEAKLDKDTARKIFKDKGITKLKLVTADFTPGMNDGADLAARQLKEVGIDVQVEKRDPATYYSDMEALKKLPFFASYFVNRSLTSALSFMTGSKAMFNLSGFGRETSWDERLEKLQAETDPNSRNQQLSELARTLQKMAEIFCGATPMKFMGERPKCQICRSPSQFR